MSCYSTEAFKVVPYHGYGYWVVLGTSSQLYNLLGNVVSWFLGGVVSWLLDDVVSWLLWCFELEAWIFRPTYLACYLFVSLIFIRESVIYTLWILDRVLVVLEF